MDTKITTKPLTSYIDTVKQVFRLAETYFKDLLEFNSLARDTFIIKLSSMDPEEFFKYIQAQEYVKDPPGIEFVNRPKISLLLSGTGHPFDCDDRTVLSLAYFMLRNYMSKVTGGKEFFDYRVLVVGRNENPHHIYIEYKKRGDLNWIPFDPTYPHNVYGVAPFSPGFIKIFYREDFVL